MAAEPEWGPGMTIQEILEAAATVAVVGMSTNPDKSAYSVPAALKAAGFRIIPVNPGAEEIQGQRAFPRLEDIPEPVDIVDVFRPSAEAPGIARSAVAIGARVLWLQVGIRSDEARRIAEGAGLAFVEDRCMGVERALHRVTKPAEPGALP